MISIDGVKIEPTKFPDGTSQVWHLPYEIIRNPDIGITVQWDFESEAEVFHLMQLLDLLGLYYIEVSLYVPFLPYGRQDHGKDNESTFALHTLGRMLQSVQCDNVITVDAHSRILDKYVNLVSEFPGRAISEAVLTTESELVVFPDRGAVARYADKVSCRKYISAEKVRDAATGKIVGIQLPDFKPTNKPVLIIDDICDGGATFCELARQLKPLATGGIHLYVSHGIFSKGLDVLRQAGIDRIFTHKGEVL